jgi:DNA helicase IV
VIVPTKHDANTVYESLRGQGITTTVLGPNERDQPDSKAVRVATMHRAKGLEFDEVVLVIPKQDGGIETKSDTMKRLKYVAITRAKKLSTVIQY